MSRPYRLGSLFTGVGGLDLGVAQALGDVEHAFMCEFDAAPSRVLAQRFPGVPNLGDVTKVDWAALKLRIDALTAGFPCPDLSVAGRQEGIAEGTRSGLWSEVVRAVDALRPELVVIENVRGLLSGKAARNSELECCPWCLGDGSTSHVRAFGRVLGDLADLGYDCQWATVAAADVGACHRRERVFIVAHPRRRAVAHTNDRPMRGERTRAEFGRGNTPAAAGGLLPTPTAHLGTSGGAQHPDKRRAGRHTVHLSDVIECELVPTLSASDGVHGGGPLNRYGSGSPKLSAAVYQQWGRYAEAVARWAGIFGHHPAPLARAPRGGQRLNPQFVEWMMGLPAGWVTDAGLPRSAQLKALGNGVVPQQAAAAVSGLLGHGHEWVAA